MLTLMAYAAASEPNQMTVDVDKRLLAIVMMVIAFWLVRKDEKWATPVAAAVGVGGLMLMFFATF